MQEHIVLSIAPTEKYPRHSEGTFLRLKDGRILFVYSRFRDASDDAAPSDLAAIYSSDEGETWTEPETVIEAAQYNTRNIMSASLMRMENGDVGLFYIVKQAPGYSRIMLSRSNDEGKTWYSHTECTLADRKGYYVLNNDRAERLSSGRIILPLAYHRGGHGSEECYMDSRAVDCFLYSDDDGRTWAEAPDIVFPPFGGSWTGLQEPGVIEKKNGVLWGYARTDHMYQYEFFSFDGGMRWTKAQPSRFTSPHSPMKISRNPFSGDLYAVWNPAPLYNGRVCPWYLTIGRTPIVWAVSKDDGATWSGQHIIEDDEYCGYCYPAIFFTDDGAMLVAYCAGNEADGICLSRLNMKKIPV